MIINDSVALNFTRKYVSQSAFYFSKVFEDHKPHAML